MSLTKVGPNWEGQAGESETITIQPIPPQSSTGATFAAATYGVGPDNKPSALPGVAGAASITFKVIEGFHRLTFGLISAENRQQSVNIVQGSTLLSTVSLNPHSGSGSIRIIGTPANPAPVGQA